MLRWLLIALTVIAQPALAKKVGGHNNTLPSITYDARFGTNTTQTAIDGWFQFTPSNGVPIYWVDSSSGSDSNNCTAAATPCGTIDGVFTKATTAFVAGTHIRIAGTGGRTYTQAASSVSMAGLGGITATYPTVIESYDPADPTNTAKYGRLTGANIPVIYITTGTRFNDLSCGGDNYVAFQGIEFNGNDADGPGITWQCAPHTGILFQNDRFNGIQLTLNGGLGYDPTAASYMQNGNVSKSAFIGGWASGSNMNSMFVEMTNNFYLQDNVFWHAGWRVGSARDDSSANGGPAPTNHADYIEARNNGVHVERNFYADSSADGLNLRGFGVVTSNASLDEPLAGNIGAFSSSIIGEAPWGVFIKVDDWLIMGSADISSSQPRGQGPQTTNTINGSYMRNIAAFDSPKFNVGGDYFTSSYNNGNSQNISSITFSGTTATVTLAGFDKNLYTGRYISVDHAAPAAYNVVNVPVTMIDSTHFTYQLASTPATNATTVGVYTAQVPQYMLFDKVHSYNFASHLDGSITNPQYQASDAINNTWTNAITDVLAPGTGNQAASGTLFPNYKTRDQVITAVLNGVGITPGANYYIRKGQLINAALTRPDLPWSRWLIGVGFPAMGLTPLYPTPAYQTFTDTPLSKYVSTMGNLSPTSITFTHGVASSQILTGVSALPVLTASGLPSGCSISGRTISCNTSTVAGTSTVTVTENSQDGTATPHSTTITLTLS